MGQGGLAVQLAPKATLRLFSMNLEEGRGKPEKSRRRLEVSGERCLIRISSFTRRGEREGW